MFLKTEKNLFFYGFPKSDNPFGLQQTKPSTSSMFKVSTVGNMVKLVYPSESDSDDKKFELLTRTICHLPLQGLPQSIFFKSDLSHRTFLT